MMHFLTGANRSFMLEIAYLALVGEEGVGCMVTWMEGQLVAQLAGTRE